MFNGETPADFRGNSDFQGQIKDILKKLFDQSQNDHLRTLVKLLEYKIFGVENHYSAKLTAKKDSEGLLKKTVPELMTQLTETVRTTQRHALLSRLQALLIEWNAGQSGVDTTEIRRMHAEQIEFWIKVNQFGLNYLRKDFPDGSIEFEIFKDKGKPLGSISLVIRKNVPNSTGKFVEALEYKVWPKIVNKTDFGASQAFYTTDLKRENVEKFVENCLMALGETEESVKAIGVEAGE